jgi:hypothetical protein
MNGKRYSNLGSPQLLGGTVGRLCESARRDVVPAYNDPIETDGSRNPADVSGVSALHHSNTPSFLLSFCRPWLGVAVWRSRLAAVVLTAAVLWLAFSGRVLALDNPYYDWDCSYNPTNYDVNNDLVKDWIVRSGGTFDTNQLITDGGRQVWNANDVLDTRPKRGWTNDLMTAEIICKALSGSDWSMVFWMPLDYIAYPGDSTSTYSVVYFQLKTNAATQVLEMRTKAGRYMGVETDYSMGSITTNTLGYIDIRESFDTVNHQVTVTINGLQSTTYNYGTVTNTMAGQNDDAMATVVGYSGRVDRVTIRCGGIFRPLITDTNGATNISVNAAWLNGNLESTGSAASAVWVFWGTNNADKNPSGWQYTNYFGASMAEGGLTTNVTGLTPSTTYYYQFYASNTYGDCWAFPIYSFTTMAQPPTISNDGGASNVTTVAAILNGYLSSTGSAVTIVYVLWGTNSNGGAGWGIWSYTNNLGTNPVSLITNYVSALTSATTYYYEFGATNSAGMAWASVPTNFTTTSTGLVANLPFIETFESRFAGQLATQNQWQASPIAQAQVQTNQVHAGSQAGSLINGTFWHQFSDSTATNVWVDFCMKAPRRNMSSPTISNKTAAAFYIDNNGNVVAYDNNAWVTFSGAGAFVAPTDDWIRVTANLRYTTKRWSLFACSNIANGLAMTLSTNLQFQASSTNATVNIFRIGATNSLTSGYADDISVVNNASNGVPLCIDTNGNNMSDRWEMQYFGTMTNTAGADYDGDGWNNLQEYIAGTDPMNPASYMRIVSCDISSTNSANISVAVFGGGSSAQSIYAADSIARTFAILTASNDITKVKAAVTNISDGLTGTNTWIDSNAVNAYSSRFYNVAVTFGGSTFTNNETNTMAMFVQPRTQNQRYLVCLPIDYGSAALANLNSTGGQQIGRGLYANSNTNLADYIEYRDTNTGGYVYYRWTTNSSGTPYWWPDGGAAGATADVQITAGKAFWVVRGANSGTFRSNAVFSGKPYTTQALTNFYFTTNNGGYTMFGWALASNKWCRNTESGGRYSTPSNQLGFEIPGLGGTSSDTKQTNKLGDQIWVWKNNTWKFYWLMDNHLATGTNWNHKWWDDNSGNFANFALEPGMGYFYWHASNFNNTVIGTNFYWGPP